MDTIEANRAICAELAALEQLDPRKCAIRVISRDAEGNPLKVILYPPNGSEISYEAVRTLMFAQTEGYYWQRCE